MGQRVGAFVGRQKIQKRRGGGREKPAHVVKKPVHLAGRAQKNAAQDKANTAIRMGLTIGESQGAAPTAAENQPAFDLQGNTQSLHVADQIGGGVGVQFPQWGRVAAATLIEQDDAIVFGVEKLPMDRRRARTRTAVNEQYRKTIWIA